MRVMVARCAEIDLRRHHIDVSIGSQSIRVPHSKLGGWKYRIEGLEVVVVEDHHTLAGVHAHIRLGVAAEVVASAEYDEW